MSAMAHDAHGKVSNSKPIERRFTAEPTGKNNIRALIAGIGAALLGAGSYAAWVPDVPMDYAPYLFAAGAAGLIVAALMGDSDSAPLRVGAAGVAIEHGGAPERIAWYEVERVTLEGERVLVEGAGKRLSASRKQHGAAAAWIVKEALERVPKRVTIADDRAAQLLRGADEPGQVLPVEGIQVAGRRCKASQVIISFEQDARLCARCGEVYDKKHVPPRCLTCDAPIEHRAA
jgi:hypothetical protein